MANRTTLFAGISHDLRTPITRMQLAHEMLPADTDPELIAGWRWAPDRTLEAESAAAKLFPPAAPARQCYYSTVFFTGTETGHENRRI